MSAERGFTNPPPPVSHGREAEGITQKNPCVWVKRLEDVLETVTLKRLPDGADMAATVSSNEATNRSFFPRDAGKQHLLRFM